MTRAAIAHIEEAMRLLTIEAWQGTNPEDMKPVLHFTLAEELERVDVALGPKGHSMFASIADAIRSAYVEIRAAHIALGGGNEA